MAEFSYKARDANGQEIKGVVVAPNENIAYGILRDKRLTIISLRAQKKLKFLSSLQIGTGVKPKDIVVFARQFSVMMTSNVPIVKALRVLVRQTDNKYLKKIISDLADEVDGGAKLSESMAKYPKIFSNFFIQMVRSAETTGRLDEILDYLANQSEKDYDLKAKAKGAMIYPAFILGTLVLVGIGMIVFVLPQITGIFADSNVELPITTRILLGLSDFMTSYWWIILVALVGIFLGFKALARSPKGKRWIDLMKIRMPILGPVFSDLYLSRYARSLSTLLASGVTLTQSLDIVADVVGNTLYHDLTKETIKKVEAGASVTSIYIKNKDIPLLLSQMMSVGEQSGQLDKVLSKVADFYARELDNSLANMTNLIEPVIMVVLGVAVGFLVSAIILPIYNLSNAI